MITTLNPGTSSHIQILRIDMAGCHPEQEREDYFAIQLQVAITQQLEQGNTLVGNTYFEGNPILIFQPK